MLKRILILLVSLALGACCCGVPTSSAPPPVHAIKLGAWFYLLVDDQPAMAQGAPVLGPEFARVLRRIPCDGVIHLGNGQIQDPCGFQEGDSDLLPAGTPLHPVGDISGGQRLAAVVDGRLLTFAIRFPPD
jgi:hypothetical protein